MELIGALYDRESLDAITPYVDGLVVYSSDFSSFYMHGYGLEEIIDIARNFNKKLIVDIQFMLEDEKIDVITKFIKTLMPYKVYFLFSDLGIYQILCEQGYEMFGIYNPNTLVTNHFDLNFYNSLNLAATSISLEITLEDQAIMMEKAKGCFFMEIYGYHLMFHSKRKLLSLYLKHLGKDAILDNYDSYLIEQTRDDKYHIYESNHGTGLFRPYITSYLDSLDKLSRLSYGFVNNMFIQFADYIKILPIFRAYLDSKMSKEEAIKAISELQLYQQDGFKHQDTVYQKEKICTR